MCQHCWTTLCATCTFPTWQPVGGRRWSGLLFLQLLISFLYPQVTQSSTRLSFGLAAYFQCQVHVTHDSAPCTVGWAKAESSVMDLIPKNTACSPDSPHVWQPRKHSCEHQGTKGIKDGCWAPSLMQSIQQVLGDLLRPLRLPRPTCNCSLWKWANHFSFSLKTGRVKKIWYSSPMPKKLNQRKYRVYLEHIS